MRFLIIGFGGFLGANLRFLVQTWAAERFSSTFPLGTLVANLTGSFILAFFLTLITQRALASPDWRLFVAVGLLGGYTTFSSFTYETLSLAQEGRWLPGGINLVGNVVVGLVAAYAGIVLARAL